MKKTKIVATISDINCEVDFIQKLYDEGMNVARLNTAHQTPEDTLQAIKNIRSVSEEIGILIDTKGPEIRTAPMDEPLDVVQGESVCVVKKGVIRDSKHFSVSYNDFIHDVPIGSIILIDDGDVALEVKEHSEICLGCVVLNDGRIKGKKSINVPNVSMNLPAVSNRDRDYIDFAIENNIDFIAHSFVRRKEDLSEIQKILDEKKSDIKIISKIENQEGVDNIDEILDNSFGIMIARGDLAIEIAPEKIPGIQKMIVSKCIERTKPVIIATQMLHTMIENPRPTRAEISDVANAVFERTDALMLSGETAFGKYPFEAIKLMNKIAVEVESGLDRINKIHKDDLKNEITAYLAKAAVKASAQLNIDAILIDTVTGRTARAISVYRGRPPVYADCYKERTVRELSLSYGIYPKFMIEEDSNRGFYTKRLNHLINDEMLKKDSRVVVLAGNFGAKRGASYIEIGTPDELLSQD
jgi:pyruvate kinase